MAEWLDADHTWTTILHLYPYKLQFLKLEDVGETLQKLRHVSDALNIEQLEFSVYTIRRQIDGVNALLRETLNMVQLALIERSLAFA